MRRILVLLIALFLLLLPEAGAGELFLVRIVSVDKETKQVVVDILDGPETSEEHPEAIPKQIVIQSESLANVAAPGELVRLWGDMSRDDGILNLDSVVKSSEADPTGVRRRLRKNMQTHGQGGRGRGHGPF